MDRINWPFALAYGSLGIFVVAFWASAVVFGVPFARHVIEAATQRPAACAGLNGWDCAARAEGGW